MARGELLVGDHVVEHCVPPHLRKVLKLYSYKVIDSDVIERSNCELKWTIVKCIKQTNLFKAINRQSLIELVCFVACK